MQGRIQQMLMKIMRHMMRKSSGNAHAGLLLSGDPGLGKTTAIELLGSLLGMKTIIIEVPHIVEEHLINIPFLVFDPTTNTAKRAVEQVSTDYKLVLAHSNLYTQVVAAQPMSDQQYLEHIKKSPAEIQHLYMQMGGNAETVPPMIAQIRQKVHSILFLDEYYRQTSMRIRNILRDILNNKIGMHKIPATTYIIYASNMRDTGLEGEIPSNNQFTQVEFKAPTKEEWFGWFYRKYGNHKDVKLNKQVLERFKELLKDEDISFQDIAAGVRTSPRRWENLLLYINSSIPPDDVEEARALLTNVKNSFIHYQTEQHSELGARIVDAVGNLLQETSPFANLEGTSGYEWRQSLQHLLKLQQKTGGAMKHIPVVSGPPGIGKTLNSQAVANAFDLRLIDVDVSGVNAEDVVGIPIPANQQDGNIDVRFSRPKLYDMIMRQIKEADDAHIKELQQEHGANAKQAIDQYENRRWKYLIFFDEINRVDERTFNALRRVILEKNFGPADNESGETLRLPREALIVAAINPEGAGTSELTEHFRDVLDVVPAKASWEDTKRYLRGRKFAGVDPQVPEVAMNIIQEFVDKFKDKELTRPKEQAPFYLDFGTTIYVSPREYTDMYTGMVDEINAALQEALAQQDDPSQQQSILDALSDAAADSLIESMAFIFTKHAIEADETNQMIRDWVNALPPSVFGGIHTRVANTKSSYETVLSQYLDGKDLLSMPEDVEFTNVNDKNNHAQVVEQTSKLLVDKIHSAETVKRYILDKKYPKVVMSGDQLTASGSEKASLLENFMNTLLYTLSIHKFQSDRLLAVSKSTRNAASAIMAQLKQQNKIDAGTETAMKKELLNLATSMHSFIKKIGQ